MFLKNRQKKSNLQDLQIAFRLLILRQYISARNGLICKSLRAFVFLPASPGFQTCRYWIGGTRCQPSIGVRPRHSRGHALTSNMQMSATSDEVRTSCHYEEVYYKTKSYRCKPSPRGWPDTRYDGDSARTRTSLAGICGPSGLPRNLAVMMAGSRSQGDSYPKINSPADSGDDEGIYLGGLSPSRFRLRYHHTTEKP